MDQKTEIALFRYRIICEVLNGNRKNKSRHFKELAKRKYTVPGKRVEVKFSWRTFKKWLFLYKRYGFDGLLPSFRSDKNKSRKISKPLQQAILSELEDNNPKTVSNFYRYLIRKELITPELFTEATLRNFLKRKKITFAKDERKARKSFEMPHINMLWTADFMHGHYLVAGRKKKKTYLCVIIDDYSRMLVGAGFFFAESSLSLQITLKEAVLTYGVPNKFYCDNGKVFVSGYIHLVCANIGTALIHSKPYDSSSRGKVERVIRTIRQMFLPNIIISNGYTLEKLNTDLKCWITREYHQRVHSSTKQKPIDRYTEDLPNVKVREISRLEADHYFYHTIYRTVKNDCTIHFKKQAYEVPARYIGRKVEIRYPLDNPMDLRLFDDNKQVARLHPLDKHFNAQNTISYKEEPTDEILSKELFY